MSDNVIRWWLIRHAPLLDMPAEDGSMVSPLQKFVGQMDFPCETHHHALFAKLAAHLPQNARLITSSLTRSRQTADALQKNGLQTETRICDAAFNEQHFGAWQGMNYDDHYAAFPQFWDNPAETRPPEGESFADLCVRVAQSSETYLQKNDCRDMIVIAHAGTIRAFLKMAWNVSPDCVLQSVIDPLSLTRLQAVKTPHGWQWHLIDRNRFGITKHMMT